MQPLQQGVEAAQTRIADITKMLAAVRARQANYNLSPLARALKNTTGMFSSQTQPSY